MKITFVINESAPVFDTLEAGIELKQNARFVRFMPPANMEDSEIKRTKAWLESNGCAVKFLPKEKKQKTVAKKMAKAVKADQPRQVVNELVENSNSKNKQALKDLCQLRMDECKL